MVEYVCIWVYELNYSTNAMQVPHVHKHNLESEWAVGKCSLAVWLSKLINVKKERQLMKGKH